MGRDQHGNSSFTGRLAVGLCVAVSTLIATVATSPFGGATTDVSASPVAVSLLASGEGWILTSHHCATGTCVALERTENAGRSWSPLRLPITLERLASESISGYFPLGQLNIYFADAKDGWIYGSVQPGTSSTGVYVTPRAELWSTHDGGLTWSALPTRSLGMKMNILAVGARRRWVYVIGWRTDQTFGLWRSPTTGGPWRPVPTPPLDIAAGGTTMEGALIFKGANGWLMVGNDRGVTGAARLSSTGRWVSWATPCHRLGGGYAVPVATSATTLVGVCTIGGYGGSAPPPTPLRLSVGSNWIVTSHDGGLTFAPTSRVMVDHTSQWLNEIPGLPASPAPRSILVAKSISTGQTSSEHLYLTRNAGVTWTSVYSTPSSSLAGTIQQVTFASSKLGGALVQVTATTSILIMTTDGGRTWHRSPA